MSKKATLPLCRVSVRIDDMDSPDLFSTLETGNTRILFLDTETTGPDPGSAEVCEVAFILTEYSGFAFTGECTVYETLIKPSVPIPPEASAVNGISNKMVVNSPSSSDVFSKVAEIAEGADFISAHNLPFDHKILKRQFPGVFDRFQKKSCIDTLRLSRHVLQEIPSHALQALRYRFELDDGLTGDAHRALFDTELVQALLHHLLKDEPLSRLNGNWADLVDFINSPLEVKIFTFGKYRGNLVEDTVAGDPDYIRWLLRQKWLSEEHPDLYHTILCKTGAQK